MTGLLQLKKAAASLEKTTASFGTSLLKKVTVGGEPLIKSRCKKIVKVFKSIVITMFALNRNNDFNNLDFRNKINIHNCG